MSNINVGARAQNLDIGAEVPAITRVNLVVDSEHMYTAGNDTGRTMEVECPWGTQAMADSILATVGGVQYTPYTAERAMVDPAFEPGDAVSVGDVYSQIISADVTYNGAGLANIEAPDLDEIDDEYPAQQTQSSSIKRQLAYTRSLITKTAEQIRLEVQGVENEISYIQLGLDNITSRVRDAEGNIATLELTANSLRSEISGKIDGDYAQTLIDQTLEGIELSVSSANGSTTFKLMADGAELSTKTLNLSVNAVNISGKLTASQIDATNLKVNAANITGTLYIGDLYDDVGLVTEDNVTTITNRAIRTADISADQITSGSLFAGSITLDGFFDLTDDGEICGCMGAYDNYRGETGAAISDSRGNVYVRATNYEAKISYYDDSMVWVDEDGCYCSSAMQVSSDKRLKNSISYDLSEAEKVHMNLRPCSYRLNNDPKGKLRWGFIAQDVIAGVTGAGLDANKLALIGRSHGKYTVGYIDVIPLNTYMIHQLMVRMDALEEKYNAV